MRNSFKSTTCKKIHYCLQTRKSEDTLFPQYLDRIKRGRNVFFEVMYIHLTIFLKNYNDYTPQKKNIEFSYLYTAIFVAKNPLITCKINQYIQGSRKLSGQLWLSFGL